MRAALRWSALRPGRVLLAALELCAVLGAGRARAAPAPASDWLATVVLEDPSGRGWPLAELIGQPLLIVVADRAGSAQAVAWGERLAAARPDRLALWASPDDRDKVVVLSVADLRSVPELARPVARWVIARLVAQQTAEAGRGGPPLLLDWQGAVAERLAARPGVATAALLDRARDPTAVVAGEPSERVLAILVEAIDAIDATDAPPATTEIEDEAER